MGFDGAHRYSGIASKKITTLFLKKNTEYLNELHTFSEGIKAFGMEESIEKMQKSQKNAEI